MVRFPLKSGLVGIALAGMFALMALPTMASSTAVHAAASGATPPVVGDTGRDCHVLEVTLRGTLAPVGTCLDRTPPSVAGGLHVVSGVSPLSTARSTRTRTVATDCTSQSDVFIYADANLSGDKICFMNTGFVNLIDYQHGWGGAYGTWNDIASSWSAHQWFGVFYSDVNGEGRLYQFARYSSGNLGDTAIGNDQLSSLRIGG